MSKRYLNELVEKGHVEGWDDPRMPTIVGMRRRGFPAKAIRSFCDRIGVGKKNTIISMSILEDCVREELNYISPRVMGVLDPLKIVITNYPEGREEKFSCANHPKDESFGSRDVPFSAEIFIERSDFLEEAPKKFFRLSPGKEVRLRYGYVIKCNEVVKDDQGNVTELRCSYDPETLGGTTPDGRKVKGIIHWVSVKHAYRCPIRVYDRLFNIADPVVSEYEESLNPNALTETEAFLEPSLQSAKKGSHFQFERVGYFYLDPEVKEKHVFNRVVTLRDTWAKIKK